ncbi:nitroreductase family protein [Mucilaginibacter sp. P25]|uniref:Nitroreductase n=1 Tax=Mucilaginibacter gossypii TaxID=551996 RepID=A0A1G8NQK8_9SPHI|nr:nitroreductase family protein [Mucilaginibacter gossypii]SDI82276.1 Nitroreductase [Mucilaginibacter gossypii]
MTTEKLDINSALNWRYAAKRMTGAVVPQDVMGRILEAARLAPSGIGLQPYEILMITNAELKKQILPIAANQMQVVESSHLLVFAPWDDYTPERINGVFDYLNQQREKVSTTLDRQRQFALNYFSKFSSEENFHHAAKQAHIALGIAVAAAALERVDATPMEGFNAQELDRFLDLKSKGLRSSMLMAIGYRDEANDWNFKLPKVRKPMSELVTLYQ